jgi:hypothetical protein
MFSEIVPLLQTRLDEVPLELYYSWLSPGHGKDQLQKYNELKRWLEARMGHVSNSDLMAAIVQEFKDVTLEYSHDELCRLFGDRLLWLHQRGAQASEDDLSTIVCKSNVTYKGDTYGPDLYKGNLIRDEAISGAYEPKITQNPTF